MRTRTIPHRAVPVEAVAAHSRMGSRTLALTVATLALLGGIAAAANGSAAAHMVAGNVPAPCGTAPPCTGGINP
jgi:hypothetical protein